MSSRRAFKVLLVGVVFVFGCASKKELIQEIKMNNWMDVFYEGVRSKGQSLSRKEYEKAIQGSYQDSYGIVERRSIQVRVKDEEKPVDF